MKRTITMLSCGLSLIFAAGTSSAATCGDGVLDAGEQCDDGALNGTTNYPCDATCNVVAQNPEHIAAIQTAPNPTTQNYLVGSDTLNDVANGVLAALRGTNAVKQIAIYNGLGSSQGQRYLMGAPGTGEPDCLPVQSGPPRTNAGCEEIAPMSRQLNSAICTFERVNGTNNTAEALAICNDGIVIVSDNKSFAQYADNTASCPPANATSSNQPVAPDVFYTVNPTYAGAGKLRRSGTILKSAFPTLPADYQIGANGITGWKDVLRLVYAGCRNDQNDCSTVARSQRCSGTVNPTRQVIIDNWDLLVESGDAATKVTGDTDSAVDCSTVSGASTFKCSGGLRAAYRRDDSSGTTAVFLGFIGLGTGVTQRQTTITTTLPQAIAAISDTHIFCDGGDNEAWIPNKPTIDASHGDPIEKPCLAEDNLCGSNGKIGVVRALRSPVPEPTEAGKDFPDAQCARGKFASVAWLNTSLPVCPCGQKPSGGTCQLPYYVDSANAKHFDCVNDSLSHPSDASSCDGRVYNFVMRDDATGGVNYRDFNPPSTTTKAWFNSAQWRQNMRKLKTTLPVNGGPWTAATPATCDKSNLADPQGLVDATRLVGCVTAATTCTIGWAGREAAGNSLFDGGNEAFRINNLPPSDANLNAIYPMRRDLFISASNGFENITADCLARGADAQFCSDEVTLANAFYNITDNLSDSSNVAGLACKNASFIPKHAASCVGARGAAGCGAPTNQALTQCQPQ